jgi:transposase
LGALTGCAVNAHIGHPLEPWLALVIEVGIVEEGASVDEIAAQIPDRALRQGVALPRVSDLFGRRGTEWLDELHLEGWAGCELSGLRRLLTDTRAQLAPVLKGVRALTAADPIARALDARPGFGPVFSLTVRAEVGTIARFPDGRHLASYAGLVPRVERSGSRQWTGGITKTGSPWLRWTLVEAAIHQFRRDDDFGRWARRLAFRLGVLKARVAVARGLCHDLFRVWPRE